MKTPRLRLFFLLTALAAVTHAAAGSVRLPAVRPGSEKRFAAPPEWASLYENRRYFEHRDAVADWRGATTPAVTYYRGLLAHLFNDRRASARLLRTFLRTPGRDAPRGALRKAQETLADDLLRGQRYRDAAAEYQRLLAQHTDELTADEVSDVRNSLSLARALTDVPPQHVAWRGSRGGALPDGGGRFKVELRLGGKPLSLLTDTGANLTVLTASIARAHGVRLLETVIDVNTVTGRKSKARLGVAPVLEIGPARVSNVVILVFDDADLTFPAANFKLDGVIGFPVIEALGAVTFTRDGRVEVATSAAGRPAHGNLLLDGLTPVVEGRYRGHRLALTFDTGADSTMLFPPFLRASPEIAQKPRTPHRFGGAAGVRTVEAHRAGDVTLEIAGQAVRLPSVVVLAEETNPSSRWYHGNLGRDALRDFHGATLDFRAMNLRLWRLEPEGSGS